MSYTLARAGKVDIRVDEEQSAKLREIIELLIEAGYYRAKIKGLSPFDKIIGGMTWCIEVCNFDVDVDLLFHDSLSIGQKIALTEQIVKVLPSMKCPYRIEPHQIQGLDAIHVFPVMKWLVNQAAETRAEYQDEIRIIALDEFSRQYRNSFASVSTAEDTQQANLIRKLKLKYGPKPRFRRKTGATLQNDSENVLLTLLEYKEEVGPQGRVSLSDFLVEGESEDLPQTLVHNLLIDNQKKNKVSSRSVAAAISDQVKDIANTTLQFQKTKGNESENFFDVFSSLERQKAELKIQSEQKLSVLNDKLREEEHLKTLLEADVRRCQAVQEEIKAFHTSPEGASREDLSELSHLVEENESVKKRISDFKEKCRKEANLIETQIKDLKEDMESKDSENVDQNLIDLLTTESERLSKFRSQLGKKTREVELYKRLVDDIPGRPELSQYQRRFVELYNLVGAEHHETLQFYNMYNTLADSKFYMEKELGLLNSILDNMDKGISTPSSLVEYISQLESILEGIKQNKKKLERKRAEVRGEKSSLSQELSRLQELQLSYVKHIHLFSQEIAKNETLLREVQTKTGQSQ